jgi:cytochrome b pre-mRNA-processing protein 6
VANTAATQSPKPRNEAREINALYSLLENRYSTAVCKSLQYISGTSSNILQYPLSNAMMHPASSPEHYTTLVRELDEVPDRSFLQRIATRWKNMVRLS